MPPYCCLCVSAAAMSLLLPLLCYCICTRDVNLACLVLEYKDEEPGNLISFQEEELFYGALDMRREESEQILQNVSTIVQLTFNSKQHLRIYNKNDSGCSCCMTF